VATVVLNGLHLAWSFLKSTREIYIHSANDILWFMGIATSFSAVAIYSDLEYLSKGSFTDTSHFYPLMQASILQGVASLLFLLIRWFLPKKCLTSNGGLKMKDGLNMSIDTDAQQQEAASPQGVVRRSSSR
jgi:hypothetical protein